MPFDKLAADLFREFVAKPESQHIASEFSLRELSRLIARVKPQRVLEIGAGIGTITKLLLTHLHRPAHLTVTEAHPVCIGELTKNLQGLELTGFSTVQTAHQLDTTVHYDLVIFDGTLDDDKQYQVLQLGTWCFVDGGRNITIEALKNKLKNRKLTISMDNRLPGGKKLKLWSPRRFLGLPLPALKLEPIKGCSIGQVISQQA
jgi:hypothetical protein